MVLGRKIAKDNWEVREEIYDRTRISGLDKKMRVEVDTSDFAIREVLSIKCENK